MHLPARLLPCWTALCFVAALAQAANTSALKGKVTDGKGQTLPGATLVLRNASLALPERGLVTDAEGSFRFAGLPPADGYTLRVSLSGYAALEFTGLDLSQDEELTLDVALRPSSEVQEIVRVPGKPRVVDTETVTTSTSFSSEFIAGLPILGRDYQDVLSLAPGVTDVNGTGNPNIHGARDTSVVTLVDGVSTTDPFTGYYGQQLNIESIQEIEVITSGASAEFSRAQGGFANLLTKSGGNEFQGSFKFFLRSSRLDGDGAGVDPAELHGGVTESKDFRQVRFSDLYPFLSLSGPLRRDRLWYYVTAEYVLVETPHDALTQRFVTRTRGYRGLVKTTWQILPSNRLAFSLLLDRTVDENQGIDSLTNVESGYYFKRGGPTYTLRDTATFGPSLLLESSASWFDNNFQQLPTLNPDTNQDGFTFTDNRPWMGGNGDGILQAKERDPGMDFDADGAWDIYEDVNRDGVRGPGEDLDLDGRFTRSWVDYWTGQIMWPRGCEGEEDLNCNGLIDSETDTNLNGIADPQEDVGLECTNALRCRTPVVPGTACNGRFDTEDKNGNSLLDTYRNSGPTAFPFWTDRNGDGIAQAGEFVAPLPADRDYLIDVFGRAQGPYPRQYNDHRKRLTLRQDFSAYVADFGGTHDLKSGVTWEHEGFDRETLQRPQITLPRVTISNDQPPRKTKSAFLGAPSTVNNAAVADNLGLFVQDSYKPLPNLTLGLGVRVDLEGVASRGFTSFDAAGERQAYDDLIGLTAVDVEPYDAILPLGLSLDPLYSPDNPDSQLHLAQMATILRGIAPHAFTRHNLTVDAATPFLENYLPEGSDDLQQFIEQGGKMRRPEEFRLANNNVAPRLSVSWDPFGDGKSKAFGSWGRFYDKLFLQSVLQELGPDTVSRQYAVDSNGYDYPSGYPNNGFGTVSTGSTLSIFQVDRNLSTPFTDELTLGFEREVAPEVSLSLTYIHRNYRDQLQDIDVNHYTRIDPSTGRFMDHFGASPCTLLRIAGSQCIPPDPHSKYFSVASAPDGLPDLFVRNFLFNRIMRLGNYNTETYRGLELELVKRLSRKWQMEASYTFSKAWGDAESYRDSYGDDPSITEFEPGYMDYDQRHVVKLNALAYLPRDWQIGGTAQWASGLPYSVVEINRDSLDDVGFIQSRRRFGHRGGDSFIAESRNIHRNNAVYDFNARIQKNFVVGHASGAGFFEVFNILNSDDLRITALYSDQYALQAVGERRFGRRFQLGVQISF